MMNTDRIIESTGTIGGYLRLLSYHEIQARFAHKPAQFEPAYHDILTSIAAQHLMMGVAQKILLGYRLLVCKLKNPKNNMKMH